MAKLNDTLLARLDDGTRPCAVVLDIDFSGYGIVRSLHPYGIKLVAFAKRGKFVPESHTRLCPVIRYKSPDELKEMLGWFGRLPARPVLFLTVDLYVEFFMANREWLNKLFCIQMPGDSVLETLLSKESFSRFAIEKGISIPATHKISSEQEILQASGRYSFPVVLKPFIRKPGWTQAGLPKAYICANQQELLTAFEKCKVIDDQLLLQEWIPGGDENLYYCLTYYAETRECLGWFSGRKIRQWPVITGSTASTLPEGDEILHKMTLHLFAELPFSGFGSVEYKKHSGTGRYYVIEPTAGRLNQQEYVATLNGMNLPLLAYMDLTGVPMVPDPPPSKPVVYIDELAEISSFAVSWKRGYTNPGKWMVSLKGKKAFRYLNRKDPIVFIMLLIKAADQIRRRLFKS